LNAKDRSEAVFAEGCTIGYVLSIDKVSPVLHAVAALLEVRADSNCAIHLNANPRFRVG